MNTGINVNSKEFKKANKIEYHHIDPQYMGGSPTGKKVPLVSSYHQMITNELRKYHPYGKGKLPASERQKIMQQVYSKYPLP